MIDSNRTGRLVDLEAWVRARLKSANDPPAPPRRDSGADEAEAVLTRQTPALRVSRKKWADRKIFPLFSGPGYEPGDLRYQQTRATAKIRKQEAIRARGGVCADCRHAYPSECFHFDHRPGTGKVRNLATMWHTSSEAAVAAELAKCDLVCANCHAVRTRDRGYNVGRKTRSGKRKGEAA